VNHWRIVSFAALCTVPVLHVGVLKLRTVLILVAGSAVSTGAQKKGAVFVGSTGQQGQQFPPRTLANSGGSPVFYHNGALWKTCRQLFFAWRADCDIGVRARFHRADRQLFTTARPVFFGQVLGQYPLGESNPCSRTENAMPRGGAIGFVKIGKAPSIALGCAGAPWSPRAPRWARWSVCRPFSGAAAAGACDTMVGAAASFGAVRGGWMCARRRPLFCALGVPCGLFGVAG